MLILVENNYPDGITDRIFVQQLLETTSHDLTAIDKIQEYSQHNQKYLQILSQVDAVKNEFLQIILNHH